MEGMAVGHRLRRRVPDVGVARRDPVPDREDYRAQPQRRSERERERYAAQAAAASGLGLLAGALERIPPVPATDPLAQLRWLDRVGRADVDAVRRARVL